MRSWGLSDSSCSTIPNVHLMSAKWCYIEQSEWGNGMHIQSISGVYESDFERWIGAMSGSLKRMLSHNTYQT